MSFIQIKVIEGGYSEAQKAQIIQKITDAMVSVEGENLRPVTWVVIEEVKGGDWGIGGKCLTVADVSAFSSGKEGVLGSVST